MALYTYTVTDIHGAVIMANGWGMYIEAETLSEARAKADAEFLAPIPDMPEAPTFAASIQAKQRAAIRDGYTLLVRRKSGS